MPIRPPEKEPRKNQSKIINCSGVQNLSEAMMLSENLELWGIDFGDLVERNSDYDFDRKPKIVGHRFRGSG